MYIMKFFTRQQNISNSLFLSQNVAILTCIFALLYHLSFLFIFYGLGVYQMFRFNLFSVTLFAISTVLIFKPKTIFPIYYISTLEVIGHQYLAMKNVGGAGGFHFLILIMAVIPFLVFQNKKRWAIPSSIGCAIVFITLEGLRNTFNPVIEISPYNLRLIYYSNVTLSVLVVIGAVMVYSISSNDLEKKLTHEVEKLAQQMQFKNEEIITIQNNTIIGLSNLVENRDSDTGMHIQRTSAYVEMIATQLRKEGYFRNILTDDYIALLVKAAPMHDIGKIVVPDEILKKPGKLSPAEFSKMQLHTVEGERIINEVLGQTGELEYIKTASEIATSHHEKWNGQGYPNKLAGTAIPLSARIMAVADVFDALVSPRCYKQPFTADKACEIIKDDIAIHFDPTVARIFLKNRTKAEEIMDQYKD